MTSNVELLPCPFCGNEVQDDEGCFQSGGFRSTAAPVWSVRCGNPECNADVSATSEATAVAAWNRRANLALAAQQPAAVDVFDLDCPHSAIGGCDLCATQPGGGAS